MDHSFSPIQEQRLHSILDKGMEELKHSFDRSRGSSLSHSSSSFKPELPPSRNEFDEVKAAVFRLAGKIDQQSAKAAKRPRSRQSSRRRESGHSSKKSLSSCGSKSRGVLKEVALNRMPGEAQKLKRVVEELRAENARLRKQAKPGPELKQLKKDYAELLAKFELSENIRKKQKAIIDQLKAQVLNTAPNHKQRKRRRSAKRK